MSGLGRLCVFVEKCFMQKESGWQNEGKKDGRFTQYKRMKRETEEQKKSQKRGVLFSIIKISRWHIVCARFELTYNGISQTLNIFLYLEIFGPSLGFSSY